MRTLLEIVQAACDEIGIPRSSSVVSSGDTQTQQLLALANREGKSLAAREGRDGGWPQLRREHTDTFVADQAAYNFPSDLQYFLNTTQWDRSQHWPLRGPVSPTEWQVLKSGTIGSVGPRRRFRIMQGQIYFDPTPSSGDAGNTFVLEYYSTSWCQSAQAVAQSIWTADSDVPVLPDDCFILGLIWRFKKAKGLDYGDDKNAYEEEVSEELGRSGMAPVLNLCTSAGGVRLLDESNIPDTFPDLI